MWFDSVGLRSRNLQVLTTLVILMQVGCGPHLKRHVATSLNINLKTKGMCFFSGKRRNFQAFKPFQLLIKRKEGKDAVCS